jgi:predicted nucleic acid-binding protein
MKLTTEDTEDTERAAPETDAKVSGHIGFYSCATVPAELCRRMERERDEARAKVERQAERIRKLEGATNHACGTPLTRALRERDEAREQVAELSAVVKGLRAIMRQEAQAAEKKIKEAHEIAFRALIQRDEILKAMAI